jgi:hypothetical protein
MPVLPSGMMIARMSRPLPKLLRNSLAIACKSTAPSFAPILQRQASDLINASIAYQAESGMTLGGTNLNDERFLTTGQAQIVK